MDCIGWFYDILHLIFKNVSLNQGGIRTNEGYTSVDIFVRSQITKCMYPLVFTQQFCYGQTLLDGNNHKTISIKLYPYF